MNSLTSFLFRKINSPIRIGNGLNYNWIGDELIISPKTSFAGAVLVSLLIGGLFAAPALFIPVRTHGDQISLIGLFVFCVSWPSLFAILGYLSDGETRLNRRAI